jgi:hypothetical protein
MTLSSDFGVVAQCWNCKRVLRLSELTTDRERAAFSVHWCVECLKISTYLTAHVEYLLAQSRGRRLP